MGDDKLYGETLFHIFSQNEIYSKTYKMDRIMVDFVKFLNSSHSGINKLHHDYSYTTTQRAHKGVGKKVCSIIYALNFKNKFLIKHAKGISQKDICKRILKMNLKEALQENIYFQNNISRHNPFPKTQLQTTMNKIPSKADMKGKGKAPAVQSKEIRKASAKISDKHERRFDRDNIPSGYIASRGNVFMWWEK